MKKMFKINKTVAIVLCAFAAAACQQVTVESGGYGYMTAAVTRDDSTVEVVTKAGDESDVSFRLDIYSGDKLETTVDDYKTLLTEPLQLKASKYTVKAYNRAEVPAVFDSPRYAGEAETDIRPNTTVSANIRCSLSDVLVEPSFTADFTEKLNGYSLSVTNGMENGSLVWTSADAGRTGYFQVSESLDWTLSITNKADRTFEIKGSYKAPAAKQKYVMNFKIEEEVKGDTGAGNFRVILDDEINDKSFDYSLDFTTNEAELKTADVWAMFADLTGEYKQESVPAGLGFEYKRTDSEEWIPFTGTVTVDEESKRFSARVTGLNPETEYSFRAVSAKEAGKRIFKETTESAEEVHNMSFDNWYMNGKAPMPNAEGFSVWDSGNPGSARYDIIPTNSESDHVAVVGDGKKAAKLTSLSAPLVGFAAGNIFLGHYIKTTLSPAGALLDWGTAFTSRPLAMKGYFDYTPATIDVAKGQYSDLEGTTDICQIQVLLTDRTEMYHLDSGNNVFVDMNGDDIIAYGSVESGVATSTKSGLVNGYEPFTLKLEYRDLTRKPNMIVIVASASKYGDYFTGGVGSVLYIDEFSFVYDPAEL